MSIFQVQTQSCPYHKSIISNAHQTLNLVLNKDSLPSSQTLKFCPQINIALKGANFKVCFKMEISLNQYSQHVYKLADFKL